MADNTVLNTGTGGDTIATDDIGGVKHQWVKVEFGPADTATAVTTSVGLPTDPLDRAARDMGKIDIASLDQLPLIDYDTGGGTQNVPVIGVALPASGGSVAGGTSTNPFRVDPTGTTTQPVSGTVTANAGSGTFTISGTVTANAGTNLNTSTLALDATLTNQQITDNAAFTDGTTKLAMAGFILDDTAGTALTENDAAAARISTNRAVVCAIEDGATRARYATVTAANAVKVDGSAATQPVSGTITANQGGTWTVQPGNTANTTPWLVTTQPGTSGGCSLFHLIAAASTNTNNVKASAGQLYGWNVFNNAAYNIYVKLHNTAGTPTAGSGVVMTIGVPAGGGSNITLPTAIAFGTGIGLSIVRDITDAGTTALSANDCSVDLHFK